MTKQIGMLAVAVWCICSVSGQASAANEQIVQVLENSFINEYPQLALLTASAAEPAQPADVVQGELAQFVEAKVSTGESTDPSELANVLSASVSSDAEKTFKSYVADPIPVAVRILQGNSIHWKGFSATLVFKADSTTFDDLKMGYNKIPFEKVGPMTQEWFGQDLEGRSDIQCYFKNDNLNKYYLLWDTLSGEVFFKGIEG